MDLSRAVLLPIDMQRAFDNPDWGGRCNPALDRNGHAVLAAWRASGRPIIHVKHNSVETGSTLRPEQPGNLFRLGFEPLAHESTVEKTVNSAFIGTDLDLRLRRLGVDTIVTFGLTTDRCVSTTTRMGANMNYRMVLIEDACDCFDLTGSDGAIVSAEVLQRAHLASLRAEFATIVRTGDLLAA